MAPSRTTPSQDTTPVTAHLRILATTDLHGHLLPHDYIKDQPTQGGGLAGLGSLIAAQRRQAQAEGIPVLLLDNGDTLQGTPLASYLAEREVGPDHPIVASLNHLKFDALGLGNHDLDHGLPYLKSVARALDMPILSSNLENIDLSPLRRSVLLPVPLGEARPPLTVGVLSVLPEQSTAWNSHHLEDSATLVAPSLAIAAAAEELRTVGADLVVVLAHLGVGHADSPTAEGQAAHALTRSGRIDAMILGHTHRRLPSDDYSCRAGVDLHRSTVGGVPALMAGHAGSDLGVLDISLAHNAQQGWHILRHNCALIPNDAEVAAASDITALTTATHAEVRAHLSTPVATASAEMHSYFSLVQPALTQRLTAHAQQRLVRAALADTHYAGLPVLSAAAAHGTGGRDGVGNFMHIPAGPVLLRHIAGLNPFANQTVAIHITGSQLRQWLEHSALLFNTLDRGQPDQMLTNPDIPAFQFDTIFGLHYTIDPSAPPHARISDLRYEGTPVEDAQEFILATNQFRASGGGGYAATPPNRIVLRNTAPLHNSMIEILSAQTEAPWHETAPWKFASLGGVRANILTHPDALDRLQDIAHLNPQSKGTTSRGFIRLSVKL